MQKCLDLKLDVNVSGVLQFPSRVEEALFRMAQEALKQCSKTCRCKKSRAFLTVTSTDVLLVIKDEGRGFVIDNDIAFLSFGLQSIRDRAIALAVQLTG